MQGVVVMRFGVPFFSLAGLALLGLFIAPPAARSSERDIEQSLGLTRPLFADGPLTPIDIGADGLTDFLTVGGRLRGTETFSDDQLSLVVRNPDGSWSHTQSHRVAPGPYASTAAPRVVDLDGDGLDDVVLHAYHYDDESSFLVFFRQRPSPGLVECGRDTIPGHDLYSTLTLPLPRGFLFVFYHDGGTRIRWYRWSESAGKPVAAWELEKPPIAILTAFPAPTGGMIVAREEDESIGLHDFDASGLKAARPSASRLKLPQYYSASRVRRGAYESCWIRSPDMGPDTISVLLPSAAGDDIAVRSTVLPEEFEGYWPTFLPTSEEVLLCRRMWSPDSTATLIGHATHDGDVGRVDVLPWLGPDPMGVLETPGEEPELLVRTGRGDLWSLVRPSRWQPVHPDLPIGVERLIGTGDIDGDGLPDCAVEFETDDGVRVGVLRGLGRPPWFSDVAPVMNGETDSHTLADLNGDGREDLLALDRRADGSTALCVLAWNGWRLEVVEASRLTTPLYPYVLCRDYDGDGGMDVTTWEANPVLRWDKDLRALPPLEIEGSLPGWNRLGAADMNGDGKCESINGRASTVYATRIDFDGARYQQLGSWLCSFSPRAAIPANLDADRAQELILLGPQSYALWDFPPGGGGPVVIGGGNRSLWEGSAEDLDADGRVDIVTSDPLGITWDVAGVAESHAYQPLPELCDPDSRELAFEDLDRDGDLDLVCAGRRGLYVRVNDAIRQPARSADPLRLRIVSANPGRGSARAAVRMGTPGPMKAALYDVAGRRVWMRAQTIETGDWFELDVSPERFGRAAAGVYFLRVEGGGREATRRIVVLP
jgi:hypothetical protein